MTSADILHLVYNAIDHGYGQDSAAEVLESIKELNAQHERGEATPLSIFTLGYLMARVAQAPMGDVFMKLSIDGQSAVIGYDPDTAEYDD